MRKILAGVVIGLLLAVPVGAFAWNTNQIAGPYRVAHCGSVAETGEQNPNECSVMVSKFKDGDNYCYIAVQNVSLNQSYHDPSISCVRDEP